MHMLLYKMFLIKCCIVLFSKQSVSSVQFILHSARELEKWNMKSTPLVCLFHRDKGFSKRLLYADSLFFGNFIVSFDLNITRLCMKG